MSNKGAEITGFNEYQEKKAAAEEAAKEFEGMSNCNFDSNGQYVEPKPGKTLEEYYDEKPGKAEVQQEETEAKSEEEKKPLLEEGTPLDGMTIDEMDRMMQNLNSMVKMMEDSWTATKMEFKLTEDNMKDLYQYNEQHRTPLPENASEEETQKYDYFNGLNEIPEEEIINIFGEEHPIIGVEISQTRDRIKSAAEDYFNWASALKELSETNIAYMQIVEQDELLKMEELRVVMENETDPVQKEKMKKSLDHYWTNKYLDFLKEPLEEKEIKMLAEAYGDVKKLGYWIDRCREKLKQMGLNQKLILEISQFENRFLPEKYHCISNMLLLKFIQITRYAKTSDPNDLDRVRSVSMAVALDDTIRNIFDEEHKQRVLDNIMAFLDQMIEPTLAANPELLKKKNEEPKE